MDLEFFYSEIQALIRRFKQKYSINKSVNPIFSKIKFLTFLVVPQRKNEQGESQILLEPGQDKSFVWNCTGISDIEDLKIEIDVVKDENVRFASYA